ncbi:dynein assembly factor 3, axonemal-like, partial [Polyodon spathula]|uniref:dynein assembly factor 3, axonemal-like n=1 Tax=Polyodon spathula TaxID=7913 RepID=UPI001B7E97AD
HLRHVLKTITGLGQAGQTGDQQPNIHIYIVESSLELIGRHLLFLSLALEPPERMGLQEKAEVFLELFGNTLIRSQTAGSLREIATRLRQHIQEERLHSAIELTALRYKERDQLEAVFKFWGSTDPLTFQPARLWDARLRQYLGSRYDTREGSFDWDLSMKLHQRGTSLCFTMLPNATPVSCFLTQAGLISKAEYVRWREKGVAFELREGVYETANRTLASGALLKHEGEMVPVRGYWGDIVTSPYISFGIETEHPDLLKTANGRPTKTAQEVSYHTVLQLLQALPTRRRCAGEQMEEQAIVGDPSANQRAPSPEETAADYAPLSLDQVKIHFLPVNCVERLHERSRYKQLFNIIYCSCSLVHQLKAPLRQIAAPRAALIIELGRYVLDLHTDQVSGLADRVCDIAKEAGFTPTGPRSDVVARFQLCDP